MTEHPGEQFPPDVDPDVEPDYTPEQGEERRAQPDYDSEPGSQGEAGHTLVEEVMGRLHDLREKPVGEHAEVYADLHERLQTALVEADSDQGDNR
ncbi:hypothetical protein E1263_24550 [Kribbella antibiotica]|uniref:Uncharacterized protein n=1 Tax=Kribbella antibiotica TaxID=190195 RepID=A0A4R4ZEY3_9ACTN|nr:hypothetical protein [Kribbella antibiotica]TDD57091.1 hypothetical protein E1263_24550 [Kribbella antibiotica]